MKKRNKDIQTLDINYLFGKLSSKNRTNRDGSFKRTKVKCKPCQDEEELCLSVSRERSASGNGVTEGTEKGWGNSKQE